MSPRTRNTKTKILVEKLFKDSHTPLSLEEVFKKVKKENSRTAHSTVYRIIKKFEASGLLTKTNWKDRGSKFEWSDRPHHHHLVCEDCNTVVDIDDKIINFNENKISKNTGFVIKNHSIELTGICTPCQQNK